MELDAGVRLSVASENPAVDLSRPNAKTGTAAECDKSFATELAVPNFA